MVLLAAVGFLAVLPAGKVCADFKIIGSGSTKDAGSFSAEADISFSTDTMTVVLKNTQTGVANAGQLLSRIAFTLSNVTLTPNPNATAPTSESGVEVNVESSSSTTNLGFQSFAGSGNDWILSPHSSTTSNVNVFGHSQPGFMIIGPPDGSGNYPGANGSLTNGTFWPYFQSQATLVFSLPGVSSSTIVSDSGALFNFGTSPHENTADGTVTFFTPPPTSSVPVPPSALLMGIGCLGIFGWAGWRRVVAGRRMREQCQGVTS